MKIGRCCHCDVLVIETDIEKGVELDTENGKNANLSNWLNW